MKNYLSRIETIKRDLIFLHKEDFETATNGTHHKVFLSNNYVIRFRDDDPKLLSREANFIKKLKHPLIPRVLWIGESGDTGMMVEERLPGKDLDTVWKILSTTNKTNIIKQVVQFLKYLKKQSNDHIYSVNSGKEYSDFLNYFTDGIDKKIIKIRTINQTDRILKELLSIIKNYENKNLFSKNKKIALVHGDLIIHNLLTDGVNLTGVIDWELALYGDPDYDLFRLFYYQECAKAYHEQGIDETFEADYMDKLIAAILKSELIADKKLFGKKYQFARAIYFINALYWAANSKKTRENTDEVMGLWNKKAELNM